LPDARYSFTIYIRYPVPLFENSTLFSIWDLELRIFSPCLEFGILFMMSIPAACAKGPLNGPFADAECGGYFPRVLALAAHLFHGLSPEAQPSFLPAARLLLDALRERAFQAGGMQITTPILPIGIFNNINITLIHDGVNNRTFVLVQSIT
jgi:hypothetical protein